MKRVSNPKKIDNGHVQDYLLRCKKLGKNDSSIHLYGCSIKAYCKFLRREKILIEDICEFVEIPIGIQKSPRVLSETEMRNLLDNINTSTEFGVRDRAILELLYCSGVRSAELGDLTIEDFKGNEIHVACGKGSKYRTVPITPLASYWVEWYITQHRGIDPGPLFCMRNGCYVTNSSLLKIIQKHAYTVGIKNISPHTFRHTCATHLFLRGADSRLVQVILGHSNIGTTQRYMQMTSHNVQEMYQKLQGA